MAFLGSTRLETPEKVILGGSRQLLIFSRWKGDPLQDLVVFARGELPETSNRRKLASSGRTASGKSPVGSSHLGANKNTNFGSGTRGVGIESLFRQNKAGWMLDMGLASPFDLEPRGSWARSRLVGWGAMGLLDYPHQVQ